MAAKAPRQVVRTVEAIRKSGQTDMFNIELVQHEADRRGCVETVVWIGNNLADYGEGIFDRFIIDE